MSELLSKLDSDQLMGLFLGGTAIVGGLLVAIIAVFGSFWHKARELALKQDMLSRGMSADEIRLVLDAGSKHLLENCHSEHSA
ncbi:MAG TPA: hypothetical protein VGX78_18985 [Pirellulales bacterium]|nr:hypothetical protein [Pirellulales bacterium]